MKLEEYEKHVFPSGKKLFTREIKKLVEKPILVEKQSIELVELIQRQKRIEDDKKDFVQKKNEELKLIKQKIETIAKSLQTGVIEKTVDVIERIDFESLEKSYVEKETGEILLTCALSAKDYELDTPTIFDDAEKFVETNEKQKRSKTKASEALIPVYEDSFDVEIENENENEKDEKNISESLESIKKTFGFYPENIGLRFRGFSVIEEVDERERTVGITKGCLCVRARDGSTNPVDMKALKLTNCVTSFEDDFDNTYRYYYFSPLEKIEDE